MARDWKTGNTNSLLQKISFMLKIQHCFSWYRGDPSVVSVSVCGHHHCTTRRIHNGGTAEERSFFPFVLLYQPTTCDNCVTWYHYNLQKSHKDKPLFKKRTEWSKKFWKPLLEFVIGNCSRYQCMLTVDLYNHHIFLVSTTTIIPWIAIPSDMREQNHKDIKV